MTGKPIEAFGQDPKGLDGEATKAAVREADAPTPVGDEREAIAEALALRFIERAKLRVGTPGNWTCLADMPRSYSDDFYADADAILARLSPDRGQAVESSACPECGGSVFGPHEMDAYGKPVCETGRAAPATPADRGQAMSTPDDGERVDIGEAIRKAKIEADKTYGIAWHHLEEVSRFELFLAWRF